MPRQGRPHKTVGLQRRGGLYNLPPEIIMTDTVPKMHICKNCGFMSTRGELFEMVGDLLMCVLCLEQYTELLAYWKRTKSV
jgi:hypothetical protein